MYLLVSSIDNVLLKTTMLYANVASLKWTLSLLSVILKWGSIAALNTTHLPVFWNIIFCCVFCFLDLGKIHFMRRKHNLIQIFVFFYLLKNTWKRIKITFSSVPKSSECNFMHCMCRKCKEITNLIWVSSVILKVQFSYPTTIIHHVALLWIIYLSR